MQCKLMICHEGIFFVPILEICVFFEENFSGTFCTLFWNRFFRNSFFRYNFIRYNFIWYNSTQFKWKLGFAVQKLVFIEMIDSTNFQFHSPLFGLIKIFECIKIAQKHDTWTHLLEEKKSEQQFA